MDLYAITIQPESAFGTPLKGDTIFGHFCWQAADSGELEGGLDRWIASYRQAPFVLFSSAFPMIHKNGECLYAMPRPSLWASPPKNMKVKDRYLRMLGRKKDKNKKYLLIGEDLEIVFSEERYCSEEDLFEFHRTSLSSEKQKQLRVLTGKQRRFSGVFEQAHNTLDRLTNTTGIGQFAPFSSENIHYLPEAKLVVFALFDKDAMDIGRITEAFVEIGRWGFGRDASAGLGRFNVVGTRKMKIPEIGARACYTLAPCVPVKNSFSASYFTLFTRFGKHGGALVYAENPFKNPVVMADEGAVFVPHAQPDLSQPYIGSAVTNLSKADDRTVMQGYAIYLPCEIEVS
ncbi:hypothetical protein KAI46_13675 [bacterium]|nr:hypothetical protein [bacterium]